VRIDEPRAATIPSATMRIEVDLRGDAPGAAATSSGQGGGTPADDWDEAIPDTTGITADATRAVAVRIAPADAIDASGVALALASLTATADLIAEIREDESGAPAGRILATGRTTIARLDAPDWVHFEFAKPAVVEARVYWLVLRATGGAALWLAAPAAGTTRVGDNIAKGWTDRGGFDDIAPLHQIWARGGPDGATAKAPGGVDAPTEIAGRIRVTIGSTIVTPLSIGREKTCVATITNALQGWLAAQPSSFAVVAVPIAVAALGKGTVTIHPPEITYSI
jgi:hypothetical protein